MIIDRFHGNTNKQNIYIYCGYFLSWRKNKIKKTKNSIQIITQESTEDVYFVGRSENLKLCRRVENVICDKRKIS